MLDYLRNLRKSAAEKREELVTAYVDGALSARERRRFETEMAADAALRAEVEQLQALKTALRQIPQRRVPRNFTLDPALVGRPEPAGLVPLYPAMRLATALAAFFFVFTIALSFFTSNQVQMAGDAASVASEMAVEAEEATGVETEELLRAPDAVEAVEEPAAEEEAGEVAEMEAAEAELMMEEAMPAEDAMPAEEAMPEAVEEAEEAMEADEAAPPQPTASPPATPEPLGTAAADVADSAAAAAANGAAVEETSVPEAEQIAEEETAVAGDDRAEDSDQADAGESVTTPPPPQQINLLPLVQLGLGLLLVVLTVLTLYTRRQL